MNKPERAKDEKGDARAGFTLIEIMIVVTILGLLAALVVVNAPGIMHRNRVKIATSGIRMLQDKVDMFYSEVGSYPKTLDELVNAKDMDGIPIQILKKVPKDPWGNDYVYQLPGQGNEDYSISSLGPDKAVGGEGRNRDINSWELDQPSE